MAEQVRFLLIDSEEFQRKILGFISSEEFDKLIDNTIFADRPECKQAMIHGMCMASMLVSRCKHFEVVKETNGEEENHEQ